MRKSIIYGRWHRIAKISLVLIIIGLIISIALSLFGLRSNNLKMIELRQAVYDADKADGDVETALINLRQFVFGHMNTDLRSSDNSEPPIQLVYRFNRAIEAEQARVAALGSANQVYIDAQRHCENPSVSLMARAQCMQEYVTANGQGIPHINIPPKEFYTFDFASPLWSPDLAGISLIFAAFFTLLLLIRLIGGFFLNRFLKK